MARMLNRKKSPRPSSPKFDFTNRALRGDPPKDTPAQQAEREKMIQAHIEKHGVKRA